MSLYADSAFPVSAATASLHADELQSYSVPGTWCNAAERTALAAEARKARVAAGIQESCGDEQLTENPDLHEPARQLARDVALGGATIDRNYCAATQAAGVTEGAYVEIVGLVARLAHLDVFARGIGVSARALGRPVDDRAATFERPSVAKNEGFFTATVPNAPAGGELAKTLYGKHQAANILRSLSLVPDEARRLNRVMDEEYFSMETIFDLTHSSHEALSRPQIELVAARVSALNQCFY